MDLFDPLIIKITLPAKPAPARKISGNVVHKLLFRQTKVEAQVEDSDVTGYFKIVTGLQHPFDYVYLKDPNSRSKRQDGMVSLKAKEPFSLENWSDEIKLGWEKFPEEAFNVQPNEIKESWRDQFQFREEDSRPYVGLCGRAGVGRKSRRRLPTVFIEF